MRSHVSSTKVKVVVCLDVTDDINTSVQVYDIRTTVVIDL